MTDDPYAWGACGRPECPCWEPAGRICDEWKEFDENRYWLCAECGWPRYMHAVQPTPIRFRASRSLLESI